jgi:hypothetical protein
MGAHGQRRRVLKVCVRAPGKHTWLLFCRLSSSRQKKTPSSVPRRGAMRARISRAQTRGGRLRSHKARDAWSQPLASGRVFDGSRDRVPLNQPCVHSFLLLAVRSTHPSEGTLQVAGRAPTTPGGGRRVYGGSRVRGGGGHKLMHSGNPCRRAKTIRSPISPSVNRMLPPRPSSVGTLCLRLLAALAPACPGLPLCHRLYSPSSPLHSHRLCRADHKQSWPLHSKRTRAS